MKHGNVVALARKNALQWEQVKKVLSKTNKYKKDRLLDMKAEALTKLVLSL